MLTLLHLQILSTMSNPKVTTDSRVPVLTGVNYVSWRPAMKAYLQSTGHTWVMEIAKPNPINSKSTDAQVAHYIGWTKANDSIVGSVNMHLLGALCQHFEGKALAVELLKALDEEFSTVGIAAAYALFKELLDLHIPDSSHPSPAFSKAETLFACLKAAGYEFNDKCQAMMLLAKLLPSMDVIAQMFMQAKNTSSKPKDPSITEISKAAVLSWDQCHLTEKWKQLAQANKISAIKRKGQQNPSFQQQQKQLQGQQLQQSTDAGAEKKKSCHGKKGKGKLQDHAHIASAAFFPMMIADMPTTVNPHLYAHQSLQPYQGQGGPAFNSRIKEAFSLTDQLGVTPSCETICTLDAHISAPIGKTTLFLLDDGHGLEPFDYPPADPLLLALLDAVMTDATSTSAYVEELPSDDEEVTQAPPAKRKRTCGLCRSCKRAIQAPPADHWSEDDFIDIHGSVNGDIAEATGLKEDPWLVMIRSAPSAIIAPQCSCSALSAYMHDGRVACSSTPAVSESFFMNVNIACSCSDRVNHSKECACKHEDNGRMIWILDSGTSTHFTPHCSDFVDYVELKGDDCIPVQTPGGVIHVTGHRHLLIRWMDHVHKKSHLLDLHSTCHIPNSGVHLISLG